ncbi:MAG: extracellular solute-binding protein [Ruminococcaceae bacterium]|nr:extracellular solute-binding protein [Oscillospiraceae bacterium]
MKKTSKFAVFFLSVLFILSACQTSEPEIVPEYKIETGDVNFDGLSVTWGFSMSRYMDGVDNIFGFIPGTNFADNALERQKSIESAYNCKIIVDNNSNSTVIADKLSASLMSGSHLYDLVTCDTSVLSNFSRARGYLVGLSSLLDVQNTEKWGTPNMLEPMIWKDDVYGVVPFAWPNLLYSTTYSVFAVNETLVSQLGHSDPREYVDNREWTWDKLEETLELYTYQDAGRTVYGMHCHDADFAVNMLYSNGVSYSTYENGKVVCGAYTEKGRVALERAQEIYNVTCKDFIYPDAGTNKGSYMINGDVVMAVMDNVDIIGTTDSLMYQMDNIGILPFPQGPDAVPGEFSSGYSQMAYTTCIPVNTADVEASAMILDMMFEPFEGLETKDDIANYMADEIFFDKRDAEIFINTVRNANYGFFWEDGRVAVQAAVREGNPISSILESYESQYDQLVSEYLVNHYAGRYAVYGK